MKGLIVLTAIIVIITLVGVIFIESNTHSVYGTARVSVLGTEAVQVDPPPNSVEIRTTKYEVVWESVRFEDGQRFSNLTWEAVFVYRDTPAWFAAAASTKDPICFQVKYYSPQEPGGLYRLYSAELVE